MAMQVLNPRGGQEPQEGTSPWQRVWVGTSMLMAPGRHGWGGA